MDKITAFEYIELHPSMAWAKQVIMSLTATPEEFKREWENPELQFEIKSILFQAKVNLLTERKNAILMDSSKGGWKGLDKMLQEIDSELFTLKQRHELADDMPTSITINGVAVN